MVSGIAGICSDKPPERARLNEIPEAISEIGTTTNRTLVEPSRGNKTMTMTATYYTATGNRTKTGTWPKQGRTVAVDPKVIPLGSRLVIDGRGGYVAEDTGSSVRNNIIDIYRDSRRDCINLGRQTVKVIVE